MEWLVIIIVWLWAMGAFLMIAIGRHEKLITARWHVVAAAIVWPFAALQILVSNIIDSLRSNDARNQP